jgi:transcriptional regulator with XRE-family HTH domain
MCTSTEIPDVVREVGRTLKEERALRGWSREDAASRANLSAEHVMHVEEGYPKEHGGVTHGTTLGNLERVANVYGLRVALVRF